MIFSSGFRHPEGPVALQDGSWLIVEGGAGCIAHIAPDGHSKRTITQTGRPNGLAVDGHGSIWVAESKTPSLLRVTMDGTVDIVLTECAGEPFLFPNDLCFGPDGALYLTDSGIFIEDFAPGGRIREDYMNARIDGRVYRIDPDLKRITKLDSGIRFANGIAFGPDNNLYVNETLMGTVYRYLWKDDNVTGPREVFGNVVNPDAPAGFKGPDGMAFGEDGNLYVTVYGQRDVTVLSTGGKVVRRISTVGARPSNVAFALPGLNRIYVTECELGQVESYDVATDGLPLWTGAPAEGAAH